ncbi:MAG: hypothetical protein A2Z96_01265 [Spirochaetes bacterium GWB1_48_6]|nr:MAG: hypothetical protein A2Z96_01265 [Spirochaetes bacterium GWB1_48_6]
MKDDKVRPFKLISKNKEASEEKPVDVTQDDIIKKTSELCKMIESYEGGRAQAAAYVCFEIVVWGSESNHEALGILANVMMEYRETSEEIAREEEEKR